MHPFDHFAFAFQSSQAIFAQTQSFFLEIKFTKSIWLRDCKPRIGVKNSLF